MDDHRPCLSRPVGSCGMLTNGMRAQVVEAVEQATRHLLDRIADGLVGEEPAMTGGLAADLDVDVNVNTTASGVRIRVRVLDARSAQSSESLLGADLCVVLHLQFAGTEIRKGFLAQVKRSGKDGLLVRPADGDRDYSHWLYGGPGLELAPSGTVSVSRTSGHLAKQCRDMLAVTPAAYVWVIGESEVAVVGAMPVLSAHGHPRGRRARTDLATKSLADFFLNLVDCFLGDQAIRAWDTASLLEECRLRGARFGMLVSVDDLDQDDAARTQ